MRMYDHDVQSINELFIAERNTNYATNTRENS